MLLRQKNGESRVRITSAEMSGLGAKAYQTHFVTSRMHQLTIFENVCPSLCSTGEQDPELPVRRVYKSHDIDFADSFADTIHDTLETQTPAEVAKQKKKRIALPRLSRDVDGIHWHFQYFQDVELTIMSIDNASSPRATTF